MKKLLSLVCIFTAIAYQPARAQTYSYEPAGYNQPQYIEYKGTRYVRVPQNTIYEVQPRFTEPDRELSNEPKRRVIINTFDITPYLGVEGALGKSKYSDERRYLSDIELLFSRRTWRAGLFGGLQFNQYFGLEGFYTIGNMQDKKQDLGSSWISTTDAKNSLNFKAYGFDLLGYVPILQEIDIILGIGYGWYDFDGKVKLKNFNYFINYPITRDFKDSAKDEALRFSLGAQMMLNDHWSVRVLGRYIDFSDDEVLKEMMEFSLGLRYSF